MPKIMVSIKEAETLMGKYLNPYNGLTVDTYNHLIAIEISTLDEEILNRIAQFIVDVYENRFKRRFIERKFYYSADEAKRILRFAQNLDQSDETEARICTKKIERIASKLKAALVSEPFVYLEGFFTFRCKEMQEEAVDLCERAIDEYLMEKEYQEFIRHLKTFVQNQAERVPLIHVFHYQGQQFFLYDQYLKPYHSKETDALIKQLIDQNIHYEDLVVTTLITLAPHRIILHSSEDQHHIIRTLKNVYGERITFCNGCAQCDKWFEECALT